MSKQVLHINPVSSKNVTGKSGVPKRSNPHVSNAVDYGKGNTSTQTNSRQRISLQVIADKLDRLRFKTALFGYSRKDVWHKISRLDAMYRELYELQEFRYQSLLHDRDNLIRGSRNESPPQSKGRL